MILKRLKIQDFLCFGEVALEFADECLAFIAGRNEDASGVESNEAGKSNIFNAISWALLGTFPGAPVEGELIRRGAKAAEVALEAVLSDGRGLRIERRRTPKAGALAAVVEGKSVCGSTKVLDIQAALHRLLGLPVRRAEASREFFNRSYLVPDLADMFARLDPAQRMAMLSRFLGLEVWDRAATLARSRKSAAASRAREARAALSALESLARDRASLEEEARRLEAAAARAQEKVAACRRERELVRDALEKTRAAAALVQDAERLVELRRELEGKGAPENWEVEVGRATSLAQRVRDQRTRLEEKTSNLKEDLRRLASDLEALQEGEALWTCPECGTPLMLQEGKLERFDAEAAEMRLSAELVAKKALLEQCTAEKQELVAAEEKFLRIQQDAAEVLARVREVDELERRLAGKLTLALNAPDVEEAQRRETAAVRAEEEAVAEAAAVERELTAVRAQLAEQARREERAEELRREQAASEAEEGAAGWCAEAFPQVRAAVVATFLPEMEAHTNRHLSDLGTELQVGLEFDAVHHRLPLEVKVYDAEGECWDFSQRSLGMQARVSVCLAFALRELAAEGREPLPLFCDELADQLDAVGVELFFQLLQRQPGQRFVISHSSELADRFEERLLVTKRNGVSRVEYI